MAAAPQLEDPGRCFLQGEPRSMRRSSDPEQLFGFGPTPKRPDHRFGFSSRASRGGYPDHNPNPKPDVNPKSEVRRPRRTPNPNNSSENPEVSASSPRTVRAVGFSGLLAISHYILWVMFNNPDIWCDIHHSRLRESAEFVEFFGDLLLGRCCDIFLHDMLLVDK